MREFSMLVVAATALVVASGGRADDSPGRRIAVLGPGGVNGLACVACHGLDGAADPEKAVPRIGGESHGYLLEQLRGFASGTRSEPAMSTVAQRLEPEEMRQVAAYYAGLPTPVHRPVEVDAAQADRGALLEAFGNRRSGVPACVDCHAYGDAARAGLPTLFGQPARYLRQRLHAWRSDARGNEAQSVMHRIAARLSPAEIEDVAAWFASAAHPEASVERAPLSARDRLFARRR